MQAPNFTLEHIDGQQMSLSEFLGKPVVLVFAGKGAATQAETISRTVGQTLKERVNLVSVLHLAGVPKLARPIAKRDLKKTYEEATREAAADRQARGVPLGDPARAVVMLMDWEGSVAQAYGITGIEDTAVAILIGPDGAVQGQVSGAQAGDQIVAHLGGA